MLVGYSTSLLSWRHICSWSDTKEFLWGDLAAGTQERCGVSADSVVSIQQDFISHLLCARPKSSIGYKKDSHPQVYLVFSSCHGHDRNVTSTSQGKRGEAPSAYRMCVLAQDFSGRCVMAGIPGIA